MSRLLISILICLMVIAPSTLCEGDVMIDDLLTYNKWKFNNKRVYLNEEEQIYRQQVFFENLKIIHDHAQNKEATYEVGLNQFSDMTNEEFKQKILNKRKNLNGELNNRSLQQDQDSVISNKQFPVGPSSVDWRNKGILTPIKNQGSACGSCWSFSVIGGIESFNAIQNKKLVSFSEQQLVDCVDPAIYPRTDGCDGGFQEDGVRYAIRYGVVRSAQYPYVGFKSTCRVRSPLSSTQGFRINKFQQVPATNEGLKDALAFSPVIATVNADTWQSYKRGVFNGCGRIGMGQLNHAIIAVGYDIKGNWIIRNSWGANWGESGYIRLAPGNTCGILVDNLVITE